MIVTFVIGTLLVLLVSVIFKPDLIQKAVQATVVGFICGAIVKLAIALLKP
jgi:hypothetical protein